MAAKERERVAQDVGGPGDGPGAGKARRTGRSGDWMPCIAFRSGFYRSLES